MRSILTFVGVIAAAGAVTLSLFFGIQLLTHQQERADPVDPSTRTTRELVLRKPDHTVTVLCFSATWCDRGPGPRISDVPIPPSPAPATKPPRIDPDGDARNLDIDVDPGSLGLESTPPNPEADPCGIAELPNPQTPRRAAESGLEGVAVIEFTITAQGCVKGPKIIESTERVYNDYFLSIVRRWRYEPFLEDGKPVAREGVRVTLKVTFDDDDQEK
jgi:TonB family protein